MNEVRREKERGRRTRRGEWASGWMDEWMVGAGWKRKRKREKGGGRSALFLRVGPDAMQCIAPETERPLPCRCAREGFCTGIERIFFLDDRKMINAFAFCLLLFDVFRASFLSGTGWASSPMQPRGQRASAPSPGLVHTTTVRPPIPVCTCVPACSVLFVCLPD